MVAPTRDRVAAFVVVAALAACDARGLPRSTSSERPAAGTIELGYVTTVDTMAPGGTVDVRLSIRNATTARIEAGEYFVSYLWWDGTGVVDSGVETPVPTLSPGDEAVVAIAVQAPAHPQRTTLKVDVYDDAGRWLSDRGASRPLHFVVTVARP